MSESTYQPHGRYFEEFAEGDTVTTTRRTITEADVVNFAGLSGDFNQIHTDATYAAQDSFGQRIAHGLLVQSIATGLAVQTRFIEGTVMAFRELDCKFSRPTFIGDTIYVTLDVTETKELSRLGGGRVTMKYNVVNQDGKVVQRGNWVMLIKSKEA